MPPNPTGPTDRQTRILIRFLRKASRANSANIWKIAAEFIEKPRRQRVVINVGKIDRLADEGDIVVIPGKLLGSGAIRKRVVVAAFKISPKAAQKILDAGGEVLTIPELVRRVPKGSGVKIVT